MYGNLNPVRGRKKTGINHSVHTQRTPNRRRVVRSVHIGPHRPGRPHENVPGSGEAVDQSVRDRQTGVPVPLRNLPALVRRPNGIEGISRPNVHLAFADCRSCVDVRVEFIDRQNFPIAGSAQHDDLAMLAGDVDLAVDADG